MAVVHKNQKLPIYLDYNASTPVDPEVGKRMLPFLTEMFGNPSSSHVYGKRLKAAIDGARQQVAALLRCHEHEVVFTSGGSESNNYAIKGVVMTAYAKMQDRSPPVLPHVITSCVEHPAVLEVCRFLESSGKCTVTYLSVNTEGLVSVDDMRTSITPNTCLVTIMHANNELGSIQPVQEISKITRERGIIFHTDASQSVGKTRCNTSFIDADLITIAGHKLYAPKGVGALYIRRGTHLQKLIHGASHERGLRAGTENVMEVVGLGAACDLVMKEEEEQQQEQQQEGEQQQRHEERMVDVILKGLVEGLGQDCIRRNGPAERCRRLPNTLSISFRHISAVRLIRSIENEVAVSAGAACHSAGDGESEGTVKVSAVLQAIQLPDEWAKGTLRISTGRFTTTDECERASCIIVKAVKQLSG